jgi:hypothetical protein
MPAFATLALFEVIAAFMAFITPANTWSSVSKYFPLPISFSFAFILLYSSFERITFTALHATIRLTI